MSSEGRIVKGGCYMADLEQARSMLRMAYKDFNALIGMQGNSFFADEFSVSMSSKMSKKP